MMTKFPPEFEISGESFESRYGPPNEMDAAIGHAARHFAELDDEIIRALRVVRHARGECVDCLPDSYERRLSELEALAVNCSGWSPDVGRHDIPSDMNELANGCMLAHEMNRLVMRLHGIDGEVAPTTAARELAALLRGTADSLAPLLASEVADVADYTAMLAFDLREFVDDELVSSRCADARDATAH